MTTSIVIFGASGDLTSRKLIPALYNLYLKKRLPSDFQIVATARKPFNHDEIRKQFCESTMKFLPENFKQDSWDTFAERLFYVRVDLDQEDTFVNLPNFFMEKESDNTPNNRLYYLSVAPSYYASIVAKLGTHGMAKAREGWRRIVIEKPFGYDLPSAQALNEDVHEVFDENQVYRIDHYLGKETAQNILFFRFANVLFEPIWNRNMIDSVYITVAENVDVGHRAGYYDTSGVVRDMFQNHLFQLLMLTAMEAPTSFTADSVRDEKVKVLHSVRPILMMDTLRAQYSDYRKAEGVAVNTHTPTFAQLKLYIDNWRWQGVPFYLRSGKALKQKASEITVKFKRPPHLMFNMNERLINPNVLAIRIQPEEGIHLRFEAKEPDSQQNMRSVDMEFNYKNGFDGLQIPEAYERLLLDAINGDATLFTRSDEIEAAWKIIDPILHGWELPTAPPLAIYDRGTWGPSEAEELLELDGKHWELYCNYDLD
jgi:glucose-6-phosphate 1-dehydrogenase